MDLETYWGKKLVLIAILVSFLSGCGVKSSPSNPPGGKVDRVYPGLTPIGLNKASPTNSVSQKNLKNRRIKYKSNATEKKYVPPRPATELLLQNFQINE